MCQEERQIHGATIPGPYEAHQYAFNSIPWRQHTGLFLIRRNKSHILPCHAGSLENQLH